MITNLTPNIISRFPQWCCLAVWWLVVFWCFIVCNARYPQYVGFISALCGSMLAWCWAGVLIVCSLAEKQRAAPPSPICWLPSPRAQRIQHPASPPATALADTKLKNFKSKSVRCDGKLNEFPLCQLHSYTGLTTEHTGSIEKLITANLCSDFWV